MSLFWLVALTSAVGSLASSKSQPAPTATIDSGLIVGATTSVPSSDVVVEKYLGIPFADEPVRFSPANPVKPWSEPRNATEWGPACIEVISKSSQYFYDLIHLPPPAGGQSEDCLNLNVFTPKADNKSRPVLFWIYGGKFANGASSFPLYDGASFAAEQDVVVVTGNYRANALGFPGGDVPKEESNLG